MKYTTLAFVLGSAMILATAAGAETSGHGSSSGDDNGSSSGYSPPSDSASSHGSSGSTDTLTTSEGDPGAPHWTYEGDDGPEAWSRISVDFEACGVGSMQSPIDIANGFAGVGATIEFDYNPSPLSIKHNGHTVQVDYAPGSGITVGGKRYELLQFHFHTPSEHAIESDRTAMEVHFVHSSDDGELAVIGAMMEIGVENISLREVWAQMPRSEAPTRVIDWVLVSARDILPQDRTYYRYMGSLTTPPCSEGVNWFVLTEPITVGAEQLARFVDAVGENARPLQPIQNRLILDPRSGPAAAH